MGYVLIVLPVTFVAVCVAAACESDNPLSRFLERVARLLEGRR